ncbi:phosphoglycerate dehydrogenase-like enzyme [Herbinix hemicellulosilytica]|uniref:D-isomer specific 2-hydroxyacid dehydrogenase NAD-binding domain-containing protein n=1 Tax=Herbinix hemicellulosilytica TaxID=1564487 RepID=A0A0H5STL2_HERHM|nr:D-2-hydroxyacid dehydrogenase [Herbinix hemicellulosilytica]RBP60231.1 phosphoglycerate dehydrogenase-like enzyme [Herbinix hemicellulosilytica]CRZ33628.1 hypothetical protein HHT355_0422 [Herbinix hemicellulosilytica]
MTDRQTEILIMTDLYFNINEEQINLVKDIANKAAVTVVPNKNATDEMIARAEIIFGSPKPSKLILAQNLKWLQLPSAGADRYVNKNLYFNRNVILTNSSGVYGIPIAEHVFAMILSFNRNLPEYTLQKNEKKWHIISETREFYGSTLGVIGLGDIGHEVAKRAKAWGAKVLAVKKNISNKPDYVDELYTTENLDEVLKQSDYIVLTLPSTEKTRGIISEDRLKMMKPNAFLVNVGRGDLIDQEALVKALNNNWIAGAGLDVMTPEPLPQDSPLWELSNVLITQHSSGLSKVNDVRRLKIFIENLKRYLNNEKLLNTVDFNEGY